MNVEIFESYDSETLQKAITCWLDENDFTITNVIDIKYVMCYDPREKEMLYSAFIMYKL